MGSDGRAKLLADRIGLNKGLKRILEFIYGKCGNCPFRIVCWSKIFPDKGEAIMAYRKVFYCDGIYKGNAEETTEGKQVATFIKNCGTCGADGQNCQYLEHCICDILDADEFVGMTEATSIDVKDHVKAVTQCSHCKDASRCWSGILKDLGIGWGKAGTVFKIMIGCKFKDKKEGDLNDNA